MSAVAPLVRRQLTGRILYMAQTTLDDGTGTKTDQEVSFRECVAVLKLTCQVSWFTSRLTMSAIVCTTSRELTASLTWSTFGSTPNPSLYSEWATSPSTVKKTARNPVGEENITEQEIRIKLQMIRLLFI